VYERAKGGEEETQYIETEAGGGGGRGGEGGSRRGGEKGDTSKLPQRNG